MLKKYGDEKFLKETAVLRIEKDPAIIPDSLFKSENFLKDWIDCIKEKDCENKSLRSCTVPVYAEVDGLTYKMVYKIMDSENSDNYSVSEEIGEIELIDEDIFKEEIADTYSTQSENKITTLTDLTEQGYCPEEIQETLINIVTQIPNLKVIWTGSDVLDRVENDYSDDFSKSITEVLNNPEYEIIATSRSIKYLTGIEKNCNVLYIELDSVNNNYYISKAALEVLSSNNKRYLTELVEGRVSHNYATINKLVMFEQYEDTTEIQ